MPGCDGTGPEGKGSKTGRGQGPCTGKNCPNVSGRGRGFGRGKGFGRQQTTQSDTTSNKTDSNNSNKK